MSFFFPFCFSLLGFSVCVCCLCLCLPSASKVCQNVFQKCTKKIRRRRLFSLLPSFKQLHLDDGTVRDDGIFDDNNDSVLDDVSFLFLHGFLHVVLVDNLAVVANSGVLVDDALPHDGAVTQTDWHAARKKLALLHGLVVV